MTKHGAYQSLVECRQKCSRCNPELKNPSCSELRVFDSSEIGPYTRWHSDLKARLVVVGKDFAPVDKFMEYEGRPGVDVQTNIRLVKYLKEAGFKPGEIDRLYKDRELFFTNSVLCLPQGGQMRTHIRAEHVIACSEFLARTLKIVSPKAIAALGVHATNAVLQANNLPVVKETILSARGKTGFKLPTGVTLFAMPHPVASVSKSYQIEAWRHIQLWFEIQ